MFLDKLRIISYLIGIIILMFPAKPKFKRKCRIFTKNAIDLIILVHNNAPQSIEAQNVYRSFDGSKGLQFLKNLHLCF